MDEALKWAARCKQLERERDVLAAACADRERKTTAQRDELLAVLKDLAEWTGGHHEPGCPQDDTYNCPWIARLNTAIPGLEMRR